MRDLFAGERDELRRYGYPAARVMLALIFVVTGTGKLSGPEDAAGDIAGLGLPAPVLLAVVAGAVELGGGLLLGLGWMTAWAAGGLLLFLAFVTVVLENPLLVPGDLGVVIGMLKNLAIMGGLGMVVVWEKGR